MYEEHAVHKIPTWQYYEVIYTVCRVERKIIAATTPEHAFNALLEDSDVKYNEHVSRPPEDRTITPIRELTQEELDKLCPTPL